MPRPKPSSAILAFLLLFPSLAFCQNATAERVNSEAQAFYVLQISVIGSAGSSGASTAYQMNGTLGQPTSVGVACGVQVSLCSGFWGNFWPVVSVEAAIPRVFTNMLFQNFPNPFNPSTTIEYTVAEESAVDITVFNVTGQKTRTLVKAWKSPGRYRAIWDGRNDSGKLVASGVYFYRLKVGRHLSAKKMLLLK